MSQVRTLNESALLGLRGVAAAGVALCVCCSTLPAQTCPPVKLLAPDGAAGDYYGHVAALWGDTLAVGAHFHDVGPNIDQGAVYVYRWTGMSWTFEAQLLAADGAAGDAFGYSVAIWGDTLVAGSRYGDVGSSVNQGSACVFERHNGTWTQQAKLIASDGGPGDSFGREAAIWGDTIVIGAPDDDVGEVVNQGSAYVFVRSGSSWIEQAHFTGAGPGTVGMFAYSIAIEDDRVALGAAYESPPGAATQGAAYVFSRTGSIWTQEARLVGSDSGMGDRFGWTIAMSNGTILVGAPWHDVEGVADRGAAYVFVRNEATGLWNEQKTVPGSGAASDLFGFSVAIVGDLALVSSKNEDIGENIDQGAVYVYGRSGGAWLQRMRLLAPDGAPGDMLGHIVTLFQDTAALGTRTDDEGANLDQGSVYVVRGLACDAPCADFNQSGVVGVQDIFDFLAAYFAECTGRGAPPCYGSADFNHSGVISVQDIFDFLAAYFAGCP